MKLINWFLSCTIIYQIKIKSNEDKIVPKKLALRISRWSLWSECGTSSGKKEEGDVPVVQFLEPILNNNVDEVVTDPYELLDLAGNEVQDKKL